MFCVFHFPLSLRTYLRNGPSKPQKWPWRSWPWSCVTTKAKAPVKPIGGDPPMATTRVGESLQRCCCSVSSLLRFSSDFLSHWALNSIMNLYHPYMTSPPIPTPGVATRTREAIGDASKSHHLPRAKQWAPRHFEMRGDWFKFTHPFFATFLRQCLVFQCVSGISLVSSV